MTKSEPPVTEYSKVFKFLTDNKLPFSVITNANGKVLNVSPEWDKTMGMMIKPTDENWGDKAGLLEVVIFPNHNQGLQSAETVIMEIKNLFSNLH